jgi:hypothetical protein
MVFLFDTSALNKLHDDPDGGAIVSGLLATNRIGVSALNVVEAGRTASVTHRQSLLRLLKQMTGNDRPFEMPNVLVRRAMVAYSRRSQILNYSINSDADALWQVLINPELLDEPTRLGLDDHHRSLEEDFLRCHRAARPHFQRLFQPGATIPRRAPFLLRGYMSRPDFLREVVDQLYIGAVGETITVDRLPELFGVVPEVAGFLLAWGHSVHQRAVARESYGSNNAGIVDLWFATYLPRVDRFVTADDKQYRALRLVARIVAKRCSVIRYETFLRRMLVRR